MNFEGGSGGPKGCPNSSFGAPLGPLGPPLGSPWPPFGPSLGLLGSPWSHKVVAEIGCCPPLGLQWSILAPPLPPGSLLGPISAPQGTLWTPFWAPSGPKWCPHVLFVCSRRTFSHVPVVCLSFASRHGPQGPLQGNTEPHQATPTNPNTADTNQASPCPTRTLNTARRNARKRLNKHVK